ncbi:MAG TPA: nitrate reductase [Mycobacteriales bacterium]|nr:nitrate reductase [Mycobacteriales bacterium]
MSVVSDRTADIWGERTPYAASGAWPSRVDQHLTVDPGAVEKWVHSACALCSNGCGLDVAVAEGRIVGVRGRADDRINHGRLGPKGLYGWAGGYTSDRLTQPLVRVDGRLQPTDWDTAMNQIVAASKKTLSSAGPLGMSFYTSGQLFAEAYYALAMIARAGIGTPHLDGNTRLCTSTAAWALIESFGADGDPGSYADIDHCDTLLHVGHNVAETQTVMWARMLDRLAGPDRPKLVVIDPRRTPAAREADVHLAIRNGTNVMVLNALLNEIIANGWIDREWIDAHTAGFDALQAVVAEHPAERAAEVCGVAVEDIRRAAEILSSAERLVSTVLQGVYQSHQATAAAVQVNNIHLVRGMIGKPGATVFQMNGQPTAENTRETGANGLLPVHLNWQNDEHVEILAKHWNVDALQIPHWSPPTHVMQILRYIEQGSISFLWVNGTNPAVSLPQLGRVRELLGRDELFLVVQDAFLTETAELADVVLPAAIWGEKTGVFTNADRTVHLAEQAVEPPGQARSDLEIFIDYARRMGLTDRDGQPLLKFATSEEAWDDYRRLSEGRLCDQSELSYAKLRESEGIQWPVTKEAPGGTERLYVDGRFHTASGECESYGHDLVTGATNEKDEYVAHDPDGRAIIKAAPYVEPNESPDEEYPLSLTTGRTAFHFHTRTKTGRASELVAAAPSMWVELSRDDAAALEVAEGDIVEVASRRGRVVAPARITHSRSGLVFAPFHYGYWDAAQTADPPTAANELTLTAWDPVSKQPLFKTAAVRVTRVGPGEGPAPAPENTASQRVGAP